MWTFEFEPHVHAPLSFLGRGALLSLCRFLHDEANESDAVGERRAS